MPYVQVWVDDEDLTERSDEDLVQELEGRGFSVAKGCSVEGVGRIAHLVECGLYRDAASEALELIEGHIGKPGILRRAH